MSTLRTACGRPTRDSYGVYSTQSGQFGDINYGYVTDCTSLTSGVCNTGYTQVKGQGCLGSSQTSTFNAISSPACSSSASKCDFGTYGATNYFCQSNWDSPVYQANMVNCCSGLESSSDVCAPETCAASDPSTPPSTGPNLTQASGCHATMLGFCTPGNWTNNAVPGSGGITIQGQVACDTYVNTVNKDVKVDGNYNSAQSIIRNAIQSFYAPGSGNTPQTDHPFVQKSIALARQYPGLVDDILTNVCSQYKRSDLVVGPKTPNDPNGTNLIQTCGCFLPASEYYTDAETNVACDTLCAYPGTIPKGDGAGGQLQCGGSTCVINGVTIDLLNSNGGSVNFSQVCGSCNASGGPCRCLFGDNSISVLGNSSLAAVQVSEQCGECFSVVQNPDGTFTLNKVDCNANPSGGGSSGNIFTDTWEWMKNHIGFTVLIIVALIVLVTAIIAGIVYAEKKKK